MEINDHVDETLLNGFMEAIQKIFEENDVTTVAYSRGKDSSIILQLSVEFLLDNPQYQDKFHIISADTLVENPVIAQHVRMMKEVVTRTLNEKFVNGFTEDRFVIVKPPLDQSYESCVFGKSYTPPSSMSKWCVERLKIQPARADLRRFLQMPEAQERLAKGDSPICQILGVRSSESTTRAQSVVRHYGDNFYEEHQVIGIRTAEPIRDWTATDVATYLVHHPAPWQNEYSNRRIIDIYGFAKGAMECPIGAMISSDKDSSVKGCTGKGSAKFGCWACSVVGEDKSLKNLTDIFDEYKPYYTMRTYLKSAQDIRYGSRTGYQRVNRFGTFVPGFGDITINFRSILLQQWKKLGIPMSEEQVLMIDRLVKEREVNEGMAVNNRFREALYALLPTPPIFIGGMFNPIFEPCYLIDEDGKKVFQNTVGVDRCTNEDLKWIQRYENIVQQIQQLEEGMFIRVDVHDAYTIEGKVPQIDDEKRELTLEVINYLEHKEDAEWLLDEDPVELHFADIHDIEQIGGELTSINGKD